VASNELIEGCVSMWPREICDIREKGKPKTLFIKEFEPFRRSGVYVLYRDDQPHYIGQAKRLFNRIHDHANKSTDRYYNFWNFFSAFVVPMVHLNEVETILIAAMPTANSSQPHMSKITMPREVAAQLREIRRHATTPVTFKDFSDLRNLVQKLSRATGRAR
jgi:hypothetical protein